MIQSIVSDATMFDVPNIRSNTVNVQCRNKTDTSWTNMQSGYWSGAFNPYNSMYTVWASIPLIQNAIDCNVPILKRSTVSTVYSDWMGSSNMTQIQFKYFAEKFTFRTRIKYTAYLYSGGDAKDSASKTAFTQCSRVSVYGSGIINQVFLSASSHKNYATRVWYSATTDPSYFPELNYFEVGATDKPIMGMMKVGEYLGIIKQSDNIDTTIYLAYPTTFNEDTVYAVKQNISGIGAISNGAFNTLNGEPLFLSKNGVMGIEVSSEDVDRHVRNRSYYVNKKLCAEENISSAISFVHDGMYFLAINGHCYVLDGSQKTSWENTKTNLQYEAYYLENIPAQCFAKFNDDLWFTDFNGNACRFKTDEDEKPYHDDYPTEGNMWTSSVAPTDSMIDVSNISKEGIPAVGDFVNHDGTWYTIQSVSGTVLTVRDGVAIDAVWSTIADDDGAVHYFKTMQKKGVVVSLLPSSDSGVDVYIKADSDDPVLVGSTDAKNNELPFDFYLRKKVKKYKRLQFICRNNVVDDSFGVDQIIKSYTIGNYSKNRG